MLEQLDTWDRQAIIFLNGFHADALDQVVYYVTKTEFWFPLYAWLLFLIFRDYKKQGWFVLAGAAVCILLADRITAGLMKPFFERLRPSHDPELEGILHLVNGYRGGLYGFASSHAANTMAISLYLVMLFRHRYRYIVWMFGWAGLMCYTRIYLGVHYPGDILTGIVVGLLCGFAAFRFHQWLTKRYGQAATS
jgi:undecaprenyl-diphosphatase